MRPTARLLSCLSGHLIELEFSAHSGKMFIPRIVVSLREIVDFSPTRMLEVAVRLSPEIKKVAA